jgi:uncharacterized OB-fold protein
MNTVKEYRKPLPVMTPWSAPFWEGCKRGELLIQKCQDCQTLNFYPKLYCASCLSSNLEWVKAGGKGKVYSYMVVYAFQPTEFAEDVPYVVAVVELDEGVRMMSNIVGCPPEEVRCDMRVEVVFEKATEEITLARFRPAGRGGA